MRRGWRLVALGSACVLLAGCARSPKVLVPPRVDLASHGTIGVIAFSSDRKPELGELATQRFVEAVQAAQVGVPVLELGDEASVLQAVRRRELDFEAIRDIGRRYHVDTVLVGRLEVTEVRPSFKLSTALDGLRVKAQVEASLRVRLHAADNGATRWTRAARGAKTLAQASVRADAKPSIMANPSEDPYYPLVTWLVNEVTDDFRPHYVRP